MLVFFIVTYPRFIYWLFLGFHDFFPLLMSSALSSSSDPLNQLSLLASLNRYIFFVIPFVTRSHRRSSRCSTSPDKLGWFSRSNYSNNLMIDSHDPCFFYLIDLVSFLICIDQLWSYETLNFFSRYFSRVNHFRQSSLFNAYDFFFLSLRSIFFYPNKPQTRANIAILRKLKSFRAIFFKQLLTIEYFLLISSLAYFFIRPSDF